MAINLDKPHLWKADIARSVDMYNEWFMAFAPQAFRETRVQTTAAVEAAFQLTNNLTSIQTVLLRENPAILPTLRMAACPPLAVDRLIGLADVSPNLVRSIELRRRIPSRQDETTIDLQLGRIVAIIQKMLDPDIITWLGRSTSPSTAESHRAATIIADRLCGALANPIIRNAQEKRQLAAIREWLEARGYAKWEPEAGDRFQAMSPGAFSFHLNVSARLLDGQRSVNIPIDAVVKRRAATREELPILIEAKSAGDYTNTNKRRKEEAVKMAQLRAMYGENVRFILFLCGYFDSGYLGYEAAEGIDWIWEHRIDDLALLGI